MSLAAARAAESGETPAPLPQPDGCKGVVAPPSAPGVPARAPQSGPMSQHPAPCNHTRNTRSKSNGAVALVPGSPGFQQHMAQPPSESQQAAPTAGAPASVHTALPASPRAAARLRQQQGLANGGVDASGPASTGDLPVLAGVAPASPRAAGRRRQQQQQQQQEEQQPMPNPQQQKQQQPPGDQITQLEHAKQEQAPAEQPADGGAPSASPTHHQQQQHAEEQAAGAGSSASGHRKLRPRRSALKGTNGAGTAVQAQAPASAAEHPQAPLALLAAPAGQAPPPQPAQQQQQHVQHAHHTRLQEREAARRVSFAPGPWADKFSTHDGHPNHEGQLARQRRSAGARWGGDLTPSAVRAVEAELGQECQPSIDRLKRRVGLLPLRKRSREHHLLVNGGSLQSPASLAAAASTKEGAPSPEGASAAENGQHAKKQRGGQGGAAEQQQQGAAGQAAANGRAGKGAAAGSGAKSPKKTTALVAAAAAAAAAEDLLAKLAAGSGAPAAPPVTFTRKRGAPADAAEAANGSAAGANGSAPGAKRASQRLGGLSGPVGLLGSLSRRAGGGS